MIFFGRTPGSESNWEKPGRTGRVSWLFLHIFMRMPNVFEVCISQNVPKEVKRNCRRRYSKICILSYSIHLLKAGSSSLPGAGSWQTGMSCCVTPAITSVATANHIKHAVTFLLLIKRLTKNPQGKAKSFEIHCQENDAHRNKVHTWEPRLAQDAAHTVHIHMLRFPAETRMGTSSFQNSNGCPGRELPTAEPRESSKRSPVEGPDGQSAA